MKVLVTGGAGFIGSHLVERLLARGDNVLVLDNINDYYDPAIKRENLSNFEDSPNVKIVEGDILDRAALKTLFDENQFDVVTHLAARAGVRASLEDPILYEEVNCVGTLNMLEAVRRNDIKQFVFASSSSVYGNTKKTPFKENARIDRPVSPYASTKASCELLCYSYHHLYNLSVTALRFFTVYGPRQRPDMAIHKFTKLIDDNMPIPFYGDGTSERDYTYYTDIIDGVVSAIDRDLGFEIINLGESRTIRLSHMVSLIEKNLGKKAIRNILPMQPGDVVKTCASITRAKQLLHYRPSVNVEDGIEKFVEWYKQKNGRGGSKG